MTDTAQPIARATALAVLATLALAAAADGALGVASPGARAVHTLPLFQAAGQSTQGFARIINHSERAGTVRIHGTDDAGRRRGPVSLRLGAEESRQFNSADLERGNASAGLTGALGNGTGNWRLELSSDLDIEPSAYIRTGDGFVTAMNAVVRTAEVEGETVHRVPLFNPGSNRNQVSWLRVANLTDQRVNVEVRGRDAAGAPAPLGTVRLALPAHAARQFSARQLETGAAGLAGRLGDGEGKWQLFVTADGAIEVVSLLRSPTGHLSNLSVSGPRQGGVVDSTASHPVGSTFRDCAQLCPEVVVVPAGSYRMGSPANEAGRDADEGPVHRVTIGEPFAVGRYEVTFAQWDACHAGGGCAHRPDDQGWGRGSRPVVDVSWDDAQEYVRWLSGETGRSYRLPSEAEWEYMARAGTKTRYWWGDAVGANRANCDGCGSRHDARRTAPVGSFSANPFGLHDVHGNVWEWVQDCQTSSYDGAPGDGSAWESGDCNRRGLRGGSWQPDDLPRYLRSANRGSGGASDRRAFDTASVGFRVVRSLRSVRHTLPLFQAAGQSTQGFARIINHSERAGTVRIHGTDDAGRRRGPVSLRLGAEESRQFNSADLERGNASAGLTGALGNGTGNWRLELSSDLDIEPSAYIRTGDGFVTAMNAVVRTAEVEGETVHRVPLFNPGSNRNQVSWLRVANLTDQRVNVEVRGRDAAGAPAPLGTVRLALPAHAARQFSARQLETGAAGLAGRLGDGEGKWQLFVTADGAIEVVSLLRSPTGHLSNLSTTARRFEIVAEGATTVRPLETIQLTLPGGWVESDYRVLMDLSGKGAFAQGDTVEVEGITTDADRILVAAPMAQLLASENANNRFSLRVKRGTDGELSNIVHLAVDDIVVPAERAGYPSAVLDVLTKSIFLSADDPLLSIEGPSIRPGLMVHSARRVGLDTTFSDVQAAAILRSVYGVDVLSGTTGASDDPITPAAFVSAKVEAKVEDPFSPLLECADLGWNQILQDRTDHSALDKCTKHGTWESLKAHINNSSLTTLPALGRSAASTLINNAATKAAIAGVNRLVSWVAGARSAKLLRLAEGSEEEDDTRHFVQNAQGSMVPTKHAHEENYGNLVEIYEEAADAYPGLVSDVEQDSANRNLDAKKRGAIAELLNEADRQRGEAKAIEGQERVYTGEEEPLAAIRNDPNLGRRVGKSCDTGYEEFTVDDDTSTCVFRSLIERNCHAGSRMVPGLAGVDACLYYSLDFFRPDGSCRTNYTRVYYNGRWTCRWADLGASAPPWYTLHKTLDEDVGTDPFFVGSACVSVTNPNPTACEVTVTNNCADIKTFFVYWSRYSSQCGVDVLLSNGDLLNPNSSSHISPDWDFFTGCFPIGQRNTCEFLGICVDLFTNTSYEECASNFPPSYRP